MSRLPKLAPEKLTPESRKAFDAVARGGSINGPYTALALVPEMAQHMRPLGEYLRQETCFTPRQLELSILMTAVHCDCRYVWASHSAPARKAGLSEAVITAIQEKRRPDELTAEDAVVYDFQSELLRTHHISDTLYARMLDIFGTRGAVELVSLIGYYITLALTTNAHQVPIPE
jgi:4-carboxymuconolactone decarboxylase